MQTKLTKRDLKIIHHLSKNCRESIKSIAKETNISETSVLYRIKKLEERRIISRYKTIINPSHKVVLYGRYMWGLRNISSDELNNIITSISQIPEITFIASVQGTADLITASQTETVKEFNDIIQKIQKIAGKSIESQNASFAVSFSKCAPNILFQDNFIEPVKLEFSGKKEIVLEPIDHDILNYLTENAKISIVDLAKKCSATPKTILKHKKNLEKIGIILRYQAEINTHLLGYETYHVFWQFYDYDFDNIKKFKKYLLGLPESLYLTESLSIVNVESEFMVQNQSELFNLISRIKQKFPNLIRSNQNMLIYKIHKSSE